ncbi:uncharacterized protein LOC108038729 isoform X2 [Drosophila rhopaloa]|uniref:Uncharacterized protein n=1 Tax=Drosophila rhopaloa TaxID=1041015 RepID=A0ABM5JF09_DRORH|nr:uncharacterized protein LOC108038729 isoform X2 [Drosophila rhopaloa]
MISGYDQQNKQLHRDLAKERRRRTDELSSVIKSLFLFEIKLKNDIKVINQQLLDKDSEICRLTRLTCSLRKRLDNKQRDKSMVANQVPKSEDCLVLEALRCNNCRQQFYDIGLSGCFTREISKELSAADKFGSGSSSDDTVSSSFYGARRSVRYTSKRTAGSFQDYMRLRSLHIDDIALEKQLKTNTSSVSREDSRTSYEQQHLYPLVKERIDSVKPAQENADSDHGCLELDSQQLLPKSPSSQRSSRTTGSSESAHLEGDDGIFFNKFESERERLYSLQTDFKIVQRRCPDFSEASPKQIYETTTDDWYASASDQEELTVAAKPYNQGAVNPVLECVNQILIEQSMEETMRDLVPKSALAFTSVYSNRTRRSFLSGRRISNGRKRVHFSTKNSMVHVLRHDDNDQDIQRQPLFSHYHPSATAGDVLNYESIYSNEYEPIGSEQPSNLYVDMVAATVAAAMKVKATLNGLNATHKLPPALPPKPANLLKFNKSLLQMEMQLEDQNNCSASTTTATEPDYCSISEVGVTSVQIMADVHKAPESSSPSADDQDKLEGAFGAGGLFDDNYSHKTDEFEEIFADIPKLPNVAAIIAPKHPNYIMMKPKSAQPPRSPKSESHLQYKCKHDPNILAEINKSMTFPNSHTTSKSLPSMSLSKSVLCAVVDPSNDMPIQAEFDWYNLDEEYDQGQETSINPLDEGLLNEIGYATDTNKNREVLGPIPVATGVRRSTDTFTF